jgi:phenylacetate-CoA ligase
MSLFGQRRLPTLVQYDPVDRYFEQDGTSLLSPHVSGKLVMQVVEDEAANAQLVIVVELGRGEQNDPALASRIATAVRDAITAASSEYRSYVPAARQLPEIVLCNHHDPHWFPVGVKHRYVRR